MVRRPYRRFPMLPFFPLVPFCLSLACNLPSLSPVRRFTPTPRLTPGGLTSTHFPIPPTETPLGAFGPTRTQGPVQPTETPIGSFASTGTPTPTPTLTPTPTPTPTVLSGSPTAAALTITDVRVVAVRRDPSQPNGAIATVQVFFTGGRAPYTFADENQRKPGNRYETMTSCGASLVHTATLTSADGQSASQAYFANINCPP